MSKEPCFIIDKEGKYYTVAPGNIITGAYMKYLLYCLNSPIYYFALRKYYMGGGIEGELKTNRLLLLPVYLPADKNKLDEFENTLHENGTDESVIDDYLIKSLELKTEEYDYILKSIF